MHRCQAVVPCAICLCSSAYRLEKNKTAGSEPASVRSVDSSIGDAVLLPGRTQRVMGRQAHSAHNKPRHRGDSSISILYNIIKRLLHVTRQYSKISRRPRACGAPAPSICPFPFLGRRSEACANARVAPQIAGTSWNSQRDLKRVKITADEATEASLSKAVLSGGPGVRGGREGASQRHDIHFITLKPTVGSTRSPGFPMVSQRKE